MHACPGRHTRPFDLLHDAVWVLGVFLALGNVLWPIKARWTAYLGIADPALG